MKYLTVVLTIILSFFSSGCQNDKNQKYIDDLNSNNIRAREVAVYHLGDAKVYEAVPELIKLLKNDSSNKVKKEVVKALAEIYDVSFLNALMNKCKKWFGKETIVYFESTVTALVDMLHEDDSELVIAVIGALAKIKARNAVIPLITLLPDADISISGGVNSARDIDTGYLPYYGEKGGKVSKALNEGSSKALNEGSSEALNERSLEALNERSLEALNEKSSKDLTERGLENLYVELTVVRALGDIQDSSAVNALVPLLYHENKYVRFNVSRALKKIGER
ncbi:exported hypothetical protein [Desulfamplus magnetovallimortis]|uniref:HEAT repeat domain-containing protein n=1 Tax=Desulfamplus magnetovallimortis TaxID=1246637 RepID=A0A1W1HD33_9BACT|nr:HEAT repeat domain-containing protein [Desulfamplus magnetovallimortis]SLM30404.1 exported hypothetical protein [Desulfamplus magnetovallimortis]